MKAAPCKGCQTRFVGCHSQCLKYIDWQQQLEVEKQNRVNDAEYWGYKSDRIARVRNSWYRNGARR